MKICLMLFLMFFGMSGYSQELVCPVETPPQFPGGSDSMICFIESHLDFQKVNQSKYIGTIGVDIVIDSLGKAHFRNSYCMPGSYFTDTVLNTEIKRVIDLMPRWKPAILLDRRVPSLYMFLITTPYGKMKCPGTDTTIYFWNEVDSVPHYPIQAGDTSEYQSIKNFVKENFRFPNDFDCEGTIYIQFVINKDGSLSNFKAVNELCDWENEIIRVLRMMPSWEPAILYGRSVRSYFVLPINVPELQ